VAEIPSGTDLRLLRDEDRDFIKVAYEGRPVYVPRAAVTPPSVFPAADLAALQSFVLRRNSDLTLTAVAGLASLVPVAPMLLVWVWNGFVRGWSELMITAGVIIATSAGFWLFARTKQASVGVCDDALVLGSARDAVIVTGQIDSVTEARVSIPDIIRIQIGSFVPWTKGTMTLPPFPSHRMLQLIPKEQFSLRRWPFSISYRRVLFDPADRAGFLKAVRQAAPAIRIDTALTEKYGA
jgi:hypothetical protein